jgi:SAM-dependent methyltransferase
MKKMDWDQYYQSPVRTSLYSRRITENLLVRLIREFAPNSGRPLTIVELGGGNSCFLDRILRDVRPGAYHVIDNNQHGLDLLSKRLTKGLPVLTHHDDVLDLNLDLRADCVFSVGLIEHFDESETRIAILKHFDLLKAGGIAIITFPTPTLLYRATRSAASLLRIWRFPDERPLRMAEVGPCVAEKADVVYEKINWPIFLTQKVVVARKRN